MENRLKFQSNTINNLCFEESRYSLECLNSSNNNHVLCEDEISNYKNCKTFWFEINNFRHKHQIKPFVPDVEERERIKNNFLQNKDLKKTCDIILTEHIINK